MVNDELKIHTTLNAPKDIAPVENVVDVNLEVEDSPPTPKDTIEIYVSLGADGFVDGWGTSPPNADSVKLRIVRNHPFLDSISELWRIESGELVQQEGRLQEIISEEAKSPPTREEQLLNQNKALTDRVDFLEEVISEMIFSIYQQ